MSDRDDNRYGRPPATPASGTRAPRNRFQDVDEADIDRYLSGRPTRTDEETTANRTRSRPPANEDSPAGTARPGTARQLERLQESVERANRARRGARTAPESIRPTSAETPSRPASQAASAAQSPTRSNRRRSYMQEESDYTDVPAPELEDDEADVESWAQQPTRPTRRAAVAVDRDMDDEADFDELPARPSRRATQTRQPRPTLRRPTMPLGVANADIVNDTPALGFIGISTVGLALMAILVANRISTLDPVFATHVSASGVLEHFATRSTIWQLPLLAISLTLMNLAAAWFVSPLDRFASRFLLATSVVVQFVTWVALVRILW